MADTTRRDFIATSAAVAAATAAGRALGQAAANAAVPAGTFYQKGEVRIRYLDTGGNSFPLLVKSSRTSFASSRRTYATRTRASRPDLSRATGLGTPTPTIT
jgi:hypothetical protein